MSHVCSKLTGALAGMALAALPLLAGAQSTTSPQTPQQPPRQTMPPPEQSRPASADKSSPQHHLNEAKRVLSGITSSAPQIAELRRHFAQLEAAWNVKAASSAKMGASGSTHAGGHTTSTAGTTSGTPSATTAGTTGTPEQAGATGTQPSRQTPRSGSGEAWMTHYQAIDGVLDQLLGDTAAAVSTGAGVSVGATAGTTGVGVSAAASIDASTKTKLTDFRRHIDLFHAAAMALSRVGEEDAASASPSSGITGSMTETTASTASTTPMPPATTTATGAVGTTGSATANPDQAAIARLTVQIDELLRGTSTTSTSGTATTTSPSGTPVTGTVCVDRAKLEQLKRDIQALRR
jgi:hypothetical protein